MLLMSATGCVAEPVFMIADDNMRADEFRHYKVPGLGIGPQLETTGHVLITKTRTGNAKVFEWFIEYSLIPFVKALKRYNELDESEEAWFQLDGEAVQIYPFFEDRILKLMKENKINVGKPPAATTSITQPCDVGTCFKGPKTQNKKITKHDVSKNETMLKRLATKVFKEHNAWLNSAERSPEAIALGNKKKKPTKKDKKDTIEMNPSHVTYAKYGLLRVQMALDLCMKKTMIRESFQKSGIYPFSLEIIRRMFKVSVTTEESLAIKRNMDTLADLFQQNGEIDEVTLDNLNIEAAKEPLKRGTKRVDDYVLNRRRAVIITNDQVQQKEKAKQQMVIALEEAEEGEEVEAPLQLNIVPIVPPVVQPVDPEPKPEVSDSGRLKRKATSIEAREKMHRKDYTRSF